MDTIHHALVCYSKQRATASIEKPGINEWIMNVAVFEIYSGLLKSS